MAILVLLVLSSTILVQGYGKSNDPNEEPFLPIFPVYPYSPKLIKRETDREAVTQLSPELYAPKIDAKDSYSASYSTNYPRDPYYPNYNPYPKSSSAAGYSYYSSMPYTYPTSAYNRYNSYSTPYPAAPPSYSTMPYSTSYPNYYYQPPYYYPNYYTQPLYAPPPLPPPGADYSSDPYSDTDNEKNKEKKPSGDKRYRYNEADQDPTGNQYVDGGNYISGNTKDLDGQPSTYKASSPQNQLEQVSDFHLKNIQVPLPKTTYRVISVAGQPVGPDYPLPAPYVKAQQLEELMSQTWAKVLAQNLQQAAQYHTNDGNKNNGGQYVNQNDQNKDSQRYVSVPNVIAKAGLAYIVNPSILGKLNIAQAAGQVNQAPTTHLKNIKYPPPIPGVYTAVDKPGKDQVDSNEYENYDTSPPQRSQDYDSSLSQNDKQPQNYENEQSYQNQNFVTAQTPRGYGYQYNDYNPSQQTGQQQSNQYKNNLDDVNYGSKTKKG
ncbi:PREDICTED: cuticle collagen bli-1-like [Dufourea novaeangliae]|uniref:cuticle collagen bli-1-like n=1 Tax=Dufourea novaeangliae TaxID=178035 RepID=UPI000767C682|nr:PREDICTED: cuticle collagen bli-1-like [Dufourea novaeangliae]